MFLLSQIHNPFRHRIKELKIDQTLHLLPVKGSCVYACLKAVGYSSSSSIQTWDNIGVPPRSNGPKTLTLVLGGSFDTDTMVQELQQLPSTPRILHY